MALAYSSLEKPINQLVPRLNKSEVSSHIHAVKFELKRRGLAILSQNLDFYFGDEWFSAESLCSVSIPFYLADKRLTRVVKKFGNKPVEGDSLDSFMKLLRHEIGHSFDHAYGLSKLKSWRQIFGNPNKPYKVDQYSYNSKSLDHVCNLPDSYAQSHPQEDFAETFAVWLDPKSNWQEAYENQKVVLNKLWFIDKLVDRYKNKIPYKYSTIKDRDYSANDMNISLIQYCNSMP